MWENRRYVALRNPKKGGVYIAASSKGISQIEIEEITDNCLELIARDRTHPGICMYSLESGGYMIAMALKVAGNRMESRTHEIVRGLFLEREEIGPFCQSYMTTDDMKDLFFPSTTDYEYPENWVIPSVKSDSRKSDNILINQMNGSTALGLFHALREVSKKKMKVQLVVNDGDELKTFALLACMNEVAGTHLFVMANGECTLKLPDILILKQANYQDMRQYHRMTLEQLIHMGSNMVNKSVAEPEGDSDNQKIQELTNWCMDYITDNKISDYDMYDTLGRVYDEETYIYQRLKRCLCIELFRFGDMEYYSERYMKLLFVLFKKVVSKEKNYSLELEAAPYDYCGMYLFLKKKARNKRELRRFLIMMFETQLIECTGQFDARAIREAMHNIVELP